VYDCWNPILASVRIIAGRVNASLRKMTSGSSVRIWWIRRSQNTSGFVCGLSTRKIFTPRSSQRRITRSISRYAPSGSLSKLSG
jgi:hypothetical protein